MKYGDVTLGQVEAAINKLGGMDNWLRFLAGDLVVKIASLLKQITTVAVSGAKKFVAADAFGPDNPDGIKLYLGDNFKKHFLGKIEEDVESTTIAIHRLEKSARDPEIMTELGANKKQRIIKLAHFYQLIKAQAQGQEGSLLVNGCANIAYIPDDEGTVWAVYADWYSGSRVWSVDAYSVEDPVEWSAGYQVLSQV